MRIYILILFFLIGIVNNGKTQLNQIRWTGTVSNNWNDSLNWQPNRVPDSTCRVFITPYSLITWPPPHWPQFTGDVHVKLLQAEDAQLDFNGFDLTAGSNYQADYDHVLFRNCNLTNSVTFSDTVIIRIPNTNLFRSNTLNSGGVNTSFIGKYKFQSNDSVQFLFERCMFSDDIIAELLPLSNYGFAFGSNFYGGNVTLLHDSPSFMSFETTGLPLTPSPTVNGNLTYIYTGPPSATAILRVGNPPNLAPNPLTVRGKLFIQGSGINLKLYDIINETPGGKINLQDYSQVHIARTRLLVDSVNIESTSTPRTHFNIDSNDISGVFSYRSSTDRYYNLEHTIMKNIFRNDAYFSSINNRIIESPLPNTGNVYLGNVRFENNFTIGLQDTSVFYKDLTIIHSDSTEVHHLAFAGDEDATISANISDTLSASSINIDKTGGSKLLLSVPTYISDFARFNRGILLTQSGSYVNFMQGAEAIGHGVHSYVDGLIRKEGNESFIFPAGSSTTYKPLYMSAPTSTTDMVSVQYQPSSAHTVSDTSNREAGLPDISNCEYWEVSQVSGSSMVTLAPSWDETCLDNSYYYTDPLNAQIARWDGSIWKNAGHGDYSNGFISTAHSVLPQGLFTFASPRRVVTIPEPQPLTTMIVYPNPAVEHINIYVDQGYHTGMLIDAIGRRLSVHNLVAGRNTIRVAALPSGVYFLKLISTQKQFVLKWVKL